MGTACCWSVTATTQAQPGGGVFIFRNTGRRRPRRLHALRLRPRLHERRRLGGLRTTSDHRRRLPHRRHRLLQDPLGALATLPVGRNRRVSSNELPKWHDANLDMTILPPGKSLEMPLLEGPGVITHIWLTSHAGRVNELNALSLRIYWDGREEPGRGGAAGRFLRRWPGQTRRRSRACRSRSRPPARCRATGACRSPSPRGSWWPTTIPIAPPAFTGRWTGSNLANCRRETPYFHARYRQEYPAVPGRDYLIADLEGRANTSAR